MKQLYTQERDGLKVTLKLSDDAIKLFLDAEVAKGATPPLTLAFLQELIAPFMDIEVLDTPVLIDAVSGLKEAGVAKDRRIKKGFEAKPGANGKVLWLVKRATRQKEVDMKVDAKGFIDYSNLHLFDNVQAGQAIARIYHPKEGIDGRDALGNPIRATVGRPATYELDKSVRLELEKDNDGFDIIYSNLSGFAAEEGSKIIVFDTLNISGDVDFHCGHIDFIGAVNVSGDVHPGFNIKARGPITVRGALQGSNSISSDDSIIIKGAAFGGEKGSIVCKKNLSLNVAQSIDADVDGVIELGKEAVDCKLRTRVGISASRASIISGQAFLVRGMEVATLGTKSAKRTAVSISSDVETGKEFYTLSKDLTAHDEAIKLLKGHAGPYAYNPHRLQLLSPSQQEKLKKLLEKLRLLEGAKIRIQLNIDELLMKKNLSEVVSISIRKELNAGAEIKAGENLFPVLETLPTPTTIQYSWEKGEFSVIPYQTVSFNSEEKPDEK